MRIISGKYKGRKINPPNGTNVRPTADFAREGLFNILANYIDFESSDILDLFSGTGSVSFEFASRGALNVHLVEKDPRLISFINRMVNELNFINIRVIHIGVRDFLKTCYSKYDIVFADPPYNLPWLSDLPEMVMNAGILKDDGVFILEHPGIISFKNHSFFSEHRHYGNVNFSFFKPKDQIKNQL